MTHPSLLMYLFAHRFLQPAELWQRKREIVPCGSGVRVPTQVLAVDMVVCAFWALREADLIQLTVGTRRNAIGLTSNVVFARVVSWPESRPDSRHGLERRALTILRQPRSGGGEHDLKSMIRAWYPKKVHNVFEDVLQIEVAEGRHAGLFEEVIGTGKRGRIRVLLFGRRWTPRCDLIQRLEPESREMHERWFRFQAEERTLYLAMLDQCRSALKSREQNAGE